MATAERGLFDSVTTLKAAEVSVLVLDLRYANLLDVEQVPLAKDAFTQSSYTNQNK